MAKRFQAAESVFDAFCLSDGSLFGGKTVSKLTKILCILLGFSIVIFLSSVLVCTLAMLRGGDGSELASTGSVLMQETADRETEPQTSEQTSATEAETTMQTQKDPEESTSEVQTSVPETTIPETTMQEPTAAETTAPQETSPEKTDSAKIHVTEEVVVRDAVPLFLQTDYPKAPYGGSTVAKSGCGMTSLAMVATYLTGKEVSPADLAKRFGTYEASHAQRVEAASIVMDLSFTVTLEWDDVMDALEDGKVVIILVNSRSDFSSGQHFIVLTGLTKEGKITVNDPYGPNYSQWALKDGFKEGFSEKKVSKGFSGAWIYDNYTQPVTVDTRYPNISLTQAEKDLIAKIIWLEARGESFEGQQAIAEIIFNRMCSDNFGDTVNGVIFAEEQFRTVEFLDDAEPGELQYKAIECALTRKSVIPKEVVHFATYKVNKNVWGKIGGHYFCYDWDYKK